MKGVAVEGRDTNYTTLLEHHGKLLQMQQGRCGRIDKYPHSCIRPLYGDPVAGQPALRFQREHIIPLGGDYCGDDDLDNMQLLCVDCHVAKTQWEKGRKELKGFKEADHFHGIDRLRHDRKVEELEALLHKHKNAVERLELQLAQVEAQRAWIYRASSLPGSVASLLGWPDGFGTSPPTGAGSGSLAAATSFGDSSTIGATRNSRGAAAHY